MIVAWWQVHNPPDCPRLLGEATHQVLLSSIKINGWSCLQSSRLGNARGAHSAADRHWQLPRQIWSSPSPKCQLSNYWLRYDFVSQWSQSKTLHNGACLLNNILWQQPLGRTDGFRGGRDYGGRCWNHRNICYSCLKLCWTIQSDDHKFLWHTRCHQQMFWADDKID